MTTVCRRKTSADCGASPAACGSGWRWDRSALAATAPGGTAPVPGLRFPVLVGSGKPHGPAAADAGDHRDSRPAVLRCLR